jgi:short-subunit dehydrogenase
LSNSRLRVMITGATSGFGYLLALRLIDTKHHVIAITRDQAQADELQSRIAKESKSKKVLHYYCGFDLADRNIEEQIFSFANRTAPDVLVNCAGYSQWGSIESTAMIDLERQFRVNTLAPMLFASAFLPQWRREGRGHVINVGSTVDDSVKPFGGIYTASKVALRAMTLSLAAEVEPWGIRVNLVEPHAYKTKYSQNRRISRGDILMEYLAKHEMEEPVRNREAPDPKPVIDLLEDLITVPAEEVNLTKEQIIFRV